MPDRLNLLAHPGWAALLAALSLLVLARLSRLRPPLRPLRAPFAASVLGIALFALLGRNLDTAGALVLLYLVPILVLLVRAVVVLVEGVFRQQKGVPPPALLGTVISVLLYATGAGLIANRWFAVDLTPFLATSAVVGAVVGLAMQDTMGNLFAGIALHSEGPLRVGDWVRVGDREGRVDQVSWRAMRLVTWDGDTLTVPNNEVARHPVLNLSLPARPHTRLISLGVNYHTPPNKVISVLGNLLEQVPGMPREPAPMVRLVGYHDFAIAYEIRYPVASYEDYRRVEGEILRLVWYHFRRHGIEIPFPVRNVYLHPVEAAGPRDAAASRLERALRGIDLFRPLSDEELRLATARFRALHYSAGERIIEEDSPGDSFFVIDRGEVEVSKRVGSGARALARLMEGQFFGEMALLTGQQRTATVVAVTDVDLFTIDRAGFHDILVANPAIAVEISTILAERREALSQATDVAGAEEPPATTGELSRRILGRIRAYFGL